MTVIKLKAFYSYRYVLCPPGFIHEGHYLRKWMAQYKFQKREPMYLERVKE